MLIFKMDDLVWWINLEKIFFNLERYIEQDKIDIVAMCFDKEALAWFRLFKTSNST